jgi:hypothetical protein
MNSRVLLAIGVIIASISALITFVGTFASASSLSNFTLNVPANTTGNEGSMAPEDESGLAIACDENPEGC